MKPYTIRIKLINTFTIGIEFRYHDFIVRALQEFKRKFDVQWNPETNMWLCPYDKWSGLSFALEEKGLNLEVDSSVYDNDVKKFEYTIEKELYDDTVENLKNKIKAKLYNYQVKDVIRMASRKAFINANDMGLGKTLESLCVAELLGVFPVLIVCPVSLKQNWKKEIEKFTNRTAYVLESKKAGKDIVELFQEEYDYGIVNYEFLRKHAYRFTDRFGVVFFDEAHRLKNPKAKLVMSIREHINAPVKYFISGTPIMNRPAELWVILNMIDSEKYSDYWMFVKYFCEKRFFNKKVFYDGGRNLKLLHNILSYYMVRNTKDNVLDELPPKQYITQYVSMEKEQEKIYDDTKEEFRRWYEIQKWENGEVSMETTFLKMLRLKQASILPQLFKEGTEYVKSAKIERLDEIVGELVQRGEKLIIFSQFKKVVEMLADRYDKHGAVWFHGGTKMEDRQEAVDSFQNDKSIKLFISTQATAGVGITLTACSYIVHLDKVWNPAITEQANDRIHRIGQKSVATIISLVTNGTIDEYIENKLNEKEDIFHAIMKGEKNEKDVKQLYNTKDMLNFVFDGEIEAKPPADVQKKIDKEAEIKRDKLVSDVEDVFGTKAQKVELRQY